MFQYQKSGVEKFQNEKCLVEESEKEERE